MKRTVLAAAAGIALAGVVGLGAASAATGSGPGDRIADALAGLVRAGTITEEQAAAVGEALEDAREEARAEHERRHIAGRADVEALLQDTLGIGIDELREQLGQGRTLKEVAGDRASALAAAAVDLVAEGTTQAVADGRLTQAQADEILTRAKERAAAWLAGEDVGLGRGLGLGLLMGRGLGGGMGHGGFGNQGSGQAVQTAGENATT
jgi:hypothetical protein